MSSFRIQEGYENVTENVDLDQDQDCDNSTHHEDGDEHDDDDVCCYSQDDTSSTSTTNTITDITTKSTTNMKRRRRKVPILTSQLKLIIILLSILHLGGNNNGGTGTNNHNNNNGNGGTNRIEENRDHYAIFVAGATTTTTFTKSNTDDDDTKTNNEKSRLSRLFRANAAPENPMVPKNNNNDSTRFLTSFSFRATKAVEEPESVKSEPEEIMEKPPQVTFSEILKRAGKSGIGGGIPGAIAGVIQVLSLMWLRTIMNYQCRYGASFLQAIRALFNQGGIPRFYRGLSFALIQAPLARFVSTAANDGVETLLANLKMTKAWGPGRSTVIASMVVGMWRILLMPIDTCKTVLQVDSVDGFRSLMRKVKAGKIYVLYQGATANAVSAIFSHYPWFYTYRVLSHSSFLPNLIKSTVLRNALIGFISSVISDTFANSIRVVKTAKQAIGSKQTVSYKEVIAMILAVDGLKGLFGRGLRTRIFGNALQSVLFTVIWRGLAERKNASQNESLSRRSLEEVKSDESFNDNIKIEENDVPLEEERF
jgi:hypothetical protein